MHFKYRKEYCPKMSPIFGHSLPRVMGSGYPAQGQTMPSWWATDARVTGTSRPTDHLMRCSSAKNCDCGCREVTNILGLGINGIEPNLTLKKQ